MHLLRHGDVVFILIALCFTTSLHAKPNELARRLAKLAIDPANDPRFNDISSFDIDQFYNPRELQNADKISVFPAAPDDEVIADEVQTFPGALEDATTVEGDHQQSTTTVEGEEEASLSDEAEQSMMRAMVRAMLGFMGGVMRRIFAAGDN